MPNHTLLYIAKRLNERTIILTLPPFAGPSHHVLAPKFNLRYCASVAIKSEFIMVFLREEKNEIEGPPALDAALGGEGISVRARRVSYKQTLLRRT